MKVLLTENSMCVGGCNHFSPLSTIPAMVLYFDHVGKQELVTEHGRKENKHLEKHINHNKNSTAYRVYKNVLDAESATCRKAKNIVERNESYSIILKGRLGDV